MATLSAWPNDPDHAYFDSSSPTTVSTDSQTNPTATGEPPNVSTSSSPPKGPCEVSQTIGNPKGLCEVSQTAGNLVLVCPGLQKGQVRVEHYASKRTKLVMAHDSRIACFALTQDGGILATSSSKGTLVRVFNTVDGTLLQKVRRGADRAEIYSLAFSPTAQWLAVSSDKGTVHIFVLRINSGALSNEGPNTMLEANPSNTQSGSSLSFMKGDRVKFMGSSAQSSLTNLRGLLHGNKGEVIPAFEANSSSKNGVRFNKSVLDGNDLGGHCEINHGFFCLADQLSLEYPSTSDYSDRQAIDDIFEDENLLSEWKQKLERDTETLRAESNIISMRTMLSKVGLECKDLEALCIKEQALTNESVEKVLGWALSHHFMHSKKLLPVDSKITISCEMFLLSFILSSYYFGILKDCHVPLPKFTDHRSCFCIHVLPDCVSNL